MELLVWFVPCSIPASSAGSPVAAVVPPSSGVSASSGVWVTPAATVAGGSVPAPSAEPEKFFSSHVEHKHSCMTVRTKNQRNSICRRNECLGIVPVSIPTSKRPAEAVPSTGVSEGSPGAGVPSGVNGVSIAVVVALAPGVSVPRSAVATSATCRWVSLQ